MPSPSKILRALITTALAAALAMLLGACAEEEHHDVVEGQAAQLGDLEYKVVFSRPLNINDVEDRSYLPDRNPPPPGSSYLGVFIQIENTADEGTEQLPEEMTVVDTEGQRFQPLESESVFALDLGGELGPGDQAPALDSTAQTSPVSGALLVYEVPDEAVENRPLELVIPGAEDDARVELDI